jgi:hypothetical protein
LYTNDSFNGDGSCQDESGMRACHARASGAAFRGDVDRYLRRVGLWSQASNLILRRGNFLLGAPSIVMRSQMNVVWIDVMATEPTA